MRRSGPTPVLLQFNPDKHPNEPELHADISALCQTGDDLWLGSDETCTIERLSREEGAEKFSNHSVYSLGDYVHLPAGSTEEVDIEGLAVCENFLWVTGSHSLKREKPEAKTDKKAIKKLSKMVRETNRYLLARIPVVRDAATGHYELHKSCVDPADPEHTLHASRLFGTGATDVLTDALRQDEHLGRFLSIPSKENGFDVEGLAVMEDRIFLGLRGPVLRGWAVILEIKLEAISDTVFTLQRHGPKGALYRKHFLDLGGLGVRDLLAHGDDLLILAGPTMDLDGHVLLYRWKGVSKVGKQAVVENDELGIVLDFDFRKEPERGHNHAEGVTHYHNAAGKSSLLVVYDSPGKDRLKGAGGIIADSFPL